MSSVEELRHDCSALFQFIHRITACCQERHGPQAYDKASKEFFEYLRALGDATLRYLDRFADSAPKDSDLYYTYRQELWNLRSNWTILHSFIKPATDADTLQAPTSLLQSLAYRLSTVTGFALVKFAVFHTNDLNYLQLNTNEIRELAQRLVQLFPDGPKFPDHLGLIGFPYSQADALFSNILIAHEMGHYVFQERTNSGALGKLTTEVANAIQNALQPNVASFKPEHVQWCIKTVFSWTQELFCDLFAVQLVGPAYSFAYIELFDLVMILDPAGPSLAHATEFNASHPADALRLREQFRSLKKNGWWAEIKTTKSHYVEVLKKASSIRDKALLPPSHPIGRQTLDAFLAATPDIHGAISETLTGIDLGITEFKQYKRAIADHLVLGVVPSTLVMNGKPKYPGMVALINAGYKFYLEEINDLIDNIDGQDKTSARVRREWTNRLERWILKALEDSHLLSHQEV